MEGAGKDGRLTEGRLMEGGLGRLMEGAEAAAPAAAAPAKAAAPAAAAAHNPPCQVLQRKCFRRCPACLCHMLLPVLEMICSFFQMMGKHTPLTWGATCMRENSTPWLCHMAVVLRTVGQGQFLVLEMHPHHVFPDNSCYVHSGVML